MMHQVTIDTADFKRIMKKHKNFVQSCGNGLGYDRIRFSLKDGICNTFSLDGIKAKRSRFQYVREYLDDLPQIPEDEFTLFIPLISVPKSKKTVITWDDKEIFFEFIPMMENSIKISVENKQYDSFPDDERKLFLVGKNPVFELSFNPVELKQAMESFGSHSGSVHLKFYGKDKACIIYDLLRGYNTLIMPVKSDERGKDDEG